MHNNGIEVRRVPVETVIDLRHRVLRAGLPRQAAEFDGDHDPTSVHAAAFDRGAVVGCATLHRIPFQSRPAYQLRGMAVDPAYQRQGVGRRMLAEMDRAVQEAGVTLLWANCRKPAVPFYQRLGWDIVSEEFEIETAGPHYRMVKNMESSEPQMDTDSHG